MKPILYKLSLLSAAVLPVVLGGCSRDEMPGLEPETVTVHGREVPASAYEPNMVRVKMRKEVTEIRGEGVKSVGIIRMERTFPYAGKFEERTRKAGLHLWYDVYFDSSMELSEVGAILNSAEDVEVMEYRPKMMHLGGELRAVAFPSQLYGTSKVSGEAPFDDPLLLEQQWHYFNDGQTVSPSLPGADINVLPVWENYTVGSEDVIVAVIDSGVDYEHEDLADNMWHDEDGCCGWNFVRGNSTIIPELHGTHVSGTIAAVNNNGLGVCGIAGGDKAAGIPGVKIMNCQVFEGSNSVGGAVAMKYAADHGAVISQNSWGYETGSRDELPQSDKDAIDYFIEYAGLDENGNQTGPMAGGVVIFAAGNDGLSGNAYPAAYERCIAVAGVAADYESGYYSNYGPWVDISAPGGDQRKGPLIWSTIPDNQYGGLQGTSMACPHVSGVAALMVSLHGGPGYTADQLKEDLLAAVDDIKLYNPYISIGGGLVNACKAVLSGEGTAPEAASDLDVEVRSNMAGITLTLPSDPDGDGPAYIKVYYGEDEDFTLQDCDGAVLLPVTGYSVGDVFTGRVALPEFDSRYWLAATVLDEARYESALSEKVPVETGTNTDPVLEAVDGTSLTVTSSGKGRLRFVVSDSDGQQLTATLSPSTERTAVEWLSRDTVAVVITGSPMYEGDYEVRLKVDDGFGGTASADIAYSILENHSPVLRSEMEDMMMAPGNTATLSLADYFYDEDGEELSYSCTAAQLGVVELSVSGSTLSVSSVGEGSTTVEVMARDRGGETVAGSFNVMVSSAFGGVSVYPNPVVDVMNVRIGENASDVTVTVRRSSGAVALEEALGDMLAFRPVQVDMTSLTGGMYSVTVGYVSEDDETKSFTTSIAKL